MFVPTHLSAQSILTHLLMETSCNHCLQFSKTVSELEENDVMILFEYPICNWVSIILLLLGVFV